MFILLRSMNTNRGSKQAAGRRRSWARGVGTVTALLLTALLMATSSTQAATTNTEPTISDITNQEMDEDGVLGPIPFTISDAETPAADLSIYLDSTKPSLVPVAGIVLGGSGNNRTLTITPAEEQSGVATIIVIVNDGTETVQDSFVLTVHNVDDTPTISSVADQEVQAGKASAPIAVSLNDVDTDSALLTFSAAAADVDLLPSESFAYGGSGISRTLTLTPPAGVEGSTTVTLTVSDTNSTASTTFSLTVIPPNEPPYLSPIEDRIVKEDETLAVTFLATDKETFSDLKYLALSSNQTLVPNAKLVLGGTGTDRILTITPALDRAGETTITVSADDGEYITSRTFKLTVTAVNDPPTIEDIPSQSINEDTVLEIPLTIADPDTPLDDLTVTATSINVGVVPNQNIEIKRSGATTTLAVTPAANQHGESVIIVTVSDGDSTDTDSFLLTVLPVNDLPQVVPFEDQSTLEDKLFGPFSFVIQDVESLESTLIVTATSSNTNIVSNTNILLGGADAVRTLTVTPTPNAFGMTIMTLSIDDGESVGTYQFRFTVEAVNDRPVISQIDNATTAEDTPVTVTFAASDVETSATQLSYRMASSNPLLIPPGNGQFSSTMTERRLTLRPAANMAGTAALTVTVSDGKLEAESTFLLTVTPVNDPPVLSPVQDLSTPENTEVTVNFTVTDVDNDLNNLSFLFTSSNPGLLPSNNIVMTGESNSRLLTLKPSPGGYGETEIAIQVSDGSDLATGKFKLTVKAGPTISAILDRSTPEDEPLSLTFTVDDRDTATDKLSMSADSSNTQLISKNKLTFGGSGNERTLTIVPAANLWGSSQITITVSDGNLTASTSFHLNVEAVDDPPTIEGITDQLIDQDKQLTVVFKVSDVDTSADQITVAADAASQTLVPAGAIQISGSGTDCTLKITPAAGKSGKTVITLTASDRTSHSNATFTLTVNGAPTIGALADASMLEDTTKAVNFTVADPDNDPAALTVTALSANVDLIPNSGLALAKNGAGRTLTLMPLPDQVGTTTITLTVSDGRLSTERAFKVTVTPINDPPTINAIDDQIIDEDSVSGPVPFAIADIDTESAKLTLFGSSSDTKLVPHTNIVFGGEDRDRTITVTPLPNVSGSLQISVTVNDGNLITTRPYTLTILPVNDGPTVAPVAPQETFEDIAIAVTVTLNDIDTPAGDLTLSGQSANPALVSDAGIVFSGSGKERQMTVTPESDQAGIVALTVIVSDGSLTSSTMVTLTVINTNDGPTVELIDAQTMDEDTTLELPLLLRDIDTPPDRLNLKTTSSDVRLMPPSQISVKGNGYDRTLVLTPSHNGHGVTRIGLILDDGDLTFEHSFLVTVNPVNDPPNAVDDTYTIITMPETSFGVLANDRDVDRDPIHLIGVSQGTMGQVSINRDNTILYRMPPAFTGQDVFSYTISDGRGREDTAMVTVNVIEPHGPSTLMIDEVDPTHGLNDRSVDITIRGINFEPGTAVKLGSYPLSNVRLIDAQTLKATVPAFLPPDRYDLIVSNLDGRAAVRTGAYLVDTDKIALINVRPNRGQVDLPVHINVYGLNFDTDAIVFVGETALATSFVKSSHLQAVVLPGSVVPGHHAMTVQNRDGQKYTVADAYTAYTADSDDLFAYPYELWTAPTTLHTGQSVQLGLHVRRQIGETVLTDVEVDFYVNTPYQEDAHVGRAIVSLLLPGDDKNSEGVTWTPPAVGSYTLYAVLDPHNKVPESDENNNLIKRTVTVLPTITDMDSPVIEALTVNDGTLTTQSTAISVTVRAMDSEHPIRSIYLVEYEYIRGADQWVPVQWSGWLDYNETPMQYAWTLLSSPGIKYIQVWAADDRGNAMSYPALAAINYFPPNEDQVKAGQVRLYRFAMAAGDRLSAFLMPSQGDPDLYVWPPDFQTRSPWITNVSSGVDEVGFVAPLAGMYQLEISGHTDASYRSAVELRTLAQRATEADKSNLDPNKPRRIEPYIPVFDMPAVEYRLPSSPPFRPPVEPASPHLLYLPALQVAGQGSVDVDQATNEQVKAPFDGRQIYLPVTAR